MHYRLEDLIDIEQFQALQDRLNEIYSFPSSIIDNEGNILTATAWQDICTKFHRRHPECERECVKSDRYILEHIAEADPAVSYRCPHGLVDNATPIVIDGEHLGNFFTGQFFLEPPDLNFFRAQARRFGFDEAAYLDAVKRVPVWTREKLNSYLFFIKGLIEVITGIGLKNLRAIESSRRLEESERRFQGMFNVASIGIAQADPETGRWLRVNPKMCEITGYSAADLCRMRIPEITHPEDRDRDWNAFRRVVRGEAPSYRIEKRYIRKDGAVVWVSVNMTVLRNDEGRPIQTMATIEDITERRRSEAEQESLRAQLNQAQRLESVGRLAGGVAHDFNNMLGIILGNAEVALLQSGPGQVHFEELQEIRTAAERSATLTRQLLAFARKQTIAPEVLDLNETVETTLKMLRRLIGEDIHLVWQPGREVWPVRADPSQIDQILANLCVNARDAIAGVGTVSIQTGNALLDSAALARHPEADAGRYVVLSVSDDGCGMDEHALAHLFEPFFTTKELGKGTGLGLATVYGIVTQNRGVIDVESAPGRETTFRIYLPSHGSETEPARLARPAAALGGHETILVVEDEQAILRTTTSMLERLGYRVLAAGGAGDAIRLVREQGETIELVMTDVVMPEMNGRDLARALASICPRLRFLFTSGYPADVIGTHGVIGEGVQFIQKPFSMHALAGKLRQVLDGAGQEDGPSGDDGGFSG